MARALFCFLLVRATYWNGVVVPRSVFFCNRRRTPLVLGPKIELVSATDCVGLSVLSCFMQGHVCTHAPLKAGLIPTVSSRVLFVAVDERAVVCTSHVESKVAA